MNWKIFETSFQPETLDLKKAKLIKDRPHRKVWLLEDLVIKGFRRQLLRCDQALKEARLGILLRGLAPQVMAYGRGKSWSLVVTRRIKALNLQEFFQTLYPSLSREEKSLFWKTFAKFLQGLIQKEIFQPDFHLENVLVEGKGPFKFYLLDLHRTFRAKYHQGLFKWQLAYLLPPLLSVISWWEIGRGLFWMKDVFPTLKKTSFREEIFQKAFFLLRKHFYKKEKKHLKLLFPSIPPGIPSVKEVFEQMIKIKDSRITKGGYFPEESPLFWTKFYVAHGRLHRLKVLLGMGRARRAFFAAHRLHLRGIPTILPRGYWEKDLFVHGFQGVIFYPYHEKLKNSLGNTWRKLSSRQKEDLLWHLVRFLWEMHERGIFHGDAKISNFYFQGEQLGIIDLDATKFFKKRPSKRKRLKDLATLAFSLGWCTPEEKRNIIQKSFHFYRFLAKDIETSDFKEFKRLVEKRFTKREEKEKQRKAFS